MIKDENQEICQLEKEVQNLRLLRRSKQLELSALDQNFHSLAQSIMHYDMEKRIKMNQKIQISEVNLSSGTT